MKYVVKGNCIIFWLCIIKGKSLWWNMLNMADPFEHTSVNILRRALGNTQQGLHLVDDSPISVPQDCSEVSFPLPQSEYMSRIGQFKSLFQAYVISHFFIYPAR